MTKDIRIKDGNNRFKFRVGGIVKSEDKFLIVKMNENPFYCFPGGHVELFENTENATKRELAEELYFDIEVKQLLAINENFYKLRGDNYHELCFYYLVISKNKIEDYGDKFITEKDKFGEVIHRYKWVTIKELEEIDVRPKQIVEYVIKGEDCFKHFITRN